MQFEKSEIVFHNFVFFCISPACNFYISISLNNESFETEKKKLIVPGQNPNGPTAI